MPVAQVHKQFQAGALFAMIDEGMLLLQVNEDFDVFKKQIDELVGSKSYGPGHSPWQPKNPILGEFGRVWDLNSSKVYDKVFEAFFAQYTPPGQVRNKPTINKLALVPFTLGQPILPNDIGDQMRER